MPFLCTQFQLDWCLLRDKLYFFQITHVWCQIFFYGIGMFHTHTTRIHCDHNKQASLNRTWIKVCNGVSHLGQADIPTWLQSNSRPCRRSELEMVFSNGAVSNHVSALWFKWFDRTCVCNEPLLFKYEEDLNFGHLVRISFTWTCGGEWNVLVLLLWQSLNIILSSSFNHLQPTRKRDPVYIMVMLNLHEWHFLKENFRLNTVSLG